MLYVYNIIKNTSILNINAPKIHNVLIKTTNIFIFFFIIVKKKSKIRHFYLVFIRKVLSLRYRNDDYCNACCDN